MQVPTLTRIAVVGCGKMGEAIMSGWLDASSGSASLLTSENFVAIHPRMQRRNTLEKRYAIRCVERPCDLPEVPDLVLLAVKPQVMRGVLEDITAGALSWGGSHGALFVSIAAGLPTSRLEASLLPGTRLIRVMPNTPLLVGAGVSALCGGAQATPDDLLLVKDLFASLGSAYVVDEAHLDAVGALSGSGPAYVAAFVEALCAAGCRQGLDSDLAGSLALETLRGTALLMEKTAQSPASVREAVCSPNGTTLAALSALQASGFAQSIDKGVAAAVARSKELSAC